MKLNTAGSVENYVKVILFYFFFIRRRHKIMKSDY